MTAHSGTRGPAAGLTGRLSERGVLDRFVAGVRAGEGRALVVRGEPGVGKTMLLDYLAGRASGCLVMRAAGVQSEMELAFAGLHQLCAPMLEHAESLPVPQREALQTAFGLSAGPVPDRFLVGLAVLGLLSETARERPLIGVVDDMQWLDHASAQALGFAARRLAADPVGLAFAARVPAKDVAGLPELVVEGLAESDARELLESVLTGPLDARVRDRIIADTHGNPLALLELPRGLTPAQLTGGFGLSGAVPLDGRIEEGFARQLATLPAQTRRLVQLAAADPSGDPVLVWRAAGRLAIGAGAAGPAVQAGLAEFGARVWFRHPLVRSAAYRSASAQTGQELHGALAEVIDPAVDPDRRAWHRAQAAPGPDEEHRGGAGGRRRDREQLGPYGGLGVAAFRGREAEATELIQATMDGVTSRGEGRGVTSQYAAALLYNGLGHYDKALAAAGLVCEYDDIGVLGWSLTELVEAAVRSGQPARASDALQRLSETTRASGTNWALGTESRCRALLSEGQTAENCYREAIERLDRTRMRPAVARAHLLYGEWLRREDRRRDARAELRTAYDLFTAMGIEAFAERARRELLATGATVRKRTVKTTSELTAQEAHIAGLAVDGRSNAEIGAQLYLSIRTVEWHLSKIYTKLGVGSRRELRPALAPPRAGRPVGLATGEPYRTEHA